VPCLWQIRLGKRRPQTTSPVFGADPDMGFFYRYKATYEILFYHHYLYQAKLPKYCFLSISLQIADYLAVSLFDGLCAGQQ
jgi:hypothetical protein